MTEEIWEINCLGLKCPLPVMRLEKAFREGKGYVKVIADDPISVIDIPLAVHNLRAELLAQNSQNGIYEFEIFKKID